jgi:hypothetical protein
MELTTQKKLKGRSKEEFNWVKNLITFVKVLNLNREIP